MSAALMHSEPMRDPIVGLDDDLIEIMAMKYAQGGHFVEMTFEAYIRASLPILSMTEAA